VQRKFGECEGCVGFAMVFMLLGVGQLKELERKFEGSVRAQSNRASKAESYGRTVGGNGSWEH
jgi:hypothetical protein